MHAGINCVCNVCGSAHAWSMAVLLGQPFEYYYFYFKMSQVLFP